MGRLFLDENVQGILVESLRLAGHDVRTVRDAGLRGAPDARVLREDGDSGRVTITADLDFANIIRFPLGTHSGIVVLRLRRLLFPAFTERVLEAITYEMVENMAGCLAIIDPVKTRTRMPGMRRSVRIDRRPT